MKTDDLVTMLATGAEPVAPAATARRHGVALGWGVLAAMLLMLSLLGVRADLAAAARLPMFWVKLAFPAAVAAAALVAVMRLSRPGVSLGKVSAGLAAPIIAMWLLAAYALIGAAPDQRAALILGKTWYVCPFLIAFLSAPAFGGALWAMRGLAPTRPALAGGAAGLLAGAVATTVYALHCPEMGAPFVAIWYLLGMSMPAAAGALLGPRLLRW
jgi:hypothetical protein